MQKIEVNQETYESLKRSVRGFYYKYNTQVQRWYITKIFNYNGLLESAKYFDNFEDYFKHHTKGKEKLMVQYFNKMYDEARQKGLNPTPELVQYCLIVRLGNIYNGMYNENKVLKTFNNLAPYITCTETSKKIDIDYKVDGIVELKNVNKIGIQIKPITFLKYDKGGELRYHSKFTKKFGYKVHYVFYKDRYTIMFNNKEIKLENKKEIIKQLEKIMIYS